MNYDSFISELKSLDDTEKVLLALFNYFKDNVSYNYDELQVVKFQRGEYKSLLDIRDFSLENKENNSLELKNEIIDRLDKAFLEIEGRGLSDRNKKEWFKNYGKPYSSNVVTSGNSGFSIKSKPNNGFTHIEVNNYQPEYHDGLLQDGVCGDYSKWIKHICDDLSIPCLRVRGKGTTGHAWNLIYLKDKDTWVNFDMTMVRFYLDGWSDEYGLPEEWIFASNEEMFKMQPIRVVEKIVDTDDEIVFSNRIDENNYGELDDFLKSYGHTKI